MLTILPLEVVEYGDVDGLMLAILLLEEGRDSGSRTEGWDMLWRLLY